jgi:hypothetical protein
MRVTHKIGDVYEIDLTGDRIGYFQYVSDDQSQMASAVINVFKGIFEKGNDQRIDEIVEREVKFVAHVFLKAGYTLGSWRKIGHAAPPSKLDTVFRTSGDFGKGSSGVSRDWYVWRINEPQEKVGALPAKYQSAEIGAVMPPQEIAERMITGSYRAIYPRF